MTQLVPLADTFDDTATPYGGYHAGWLRWQPWTSDGGSGDSIACALGDLSSGYFEAGGAVRRAAAYTATSGSSLVCHWLWRAFYAARAEARLSVLWKPQPALDASGWRYAMVAVRVAGQTATDTTGSERLDAGNGYLLVLRNAGSANSAKWMLLRVNGGTVTKLTESAAFDITALTPESGLTILLRATDSSGNVVLRCQRGPVGSEGIDGGGFVDVFGADYVDSSGSKLTAAGRCGFALSKPPAGGAMLATSFQITDVDAAAVVLRDEWLRSNVRVGAAAGPDANSVSGFNLMPYFGGSVGGYAGATSRLARDAGNNRAKNVSGSSTWNCPCSIPASHASVQRRRARVTFPTSTGGITDTFGIELRGTNLHGISGPLGRAYRADVKCTNGTTFVAEIASYLGGVRTLLASKVLSGLTAGTSCLLDFETFNTGGPTALTGTPNLVLRIDTVVVSGWTSAGVVGITILANGTIQDGRSGAILTGLEHGHRYLRNSLTTGTILLDDWTDAATLPAPTTNDLASIAVSGETDGVTGTLTIPVSFRVEQNLSDPGVVHRYATEHAQSFAGVSRGRRRWKAVNDGAVSADATGLASFYDAHGTEVPFYWQTDDGDTAIVVFRNPKLTDRIRDGIVFAYEFELEERFP